MQRSFSARQAEDDMSGLDGRFGHQATSGSSGDLLSR
jgi:hypothetical protein